MPVDTNHSSVKSTEDPTLSEQARTQQEKMAAIGLQAAGMAHELKNPLTCIRGFTQLLNERLGEGHERACLRFIVDEIDRMNNIIGRFLSFARPSTPTVQNVNLNDLIGETLQLLSSECEVKRITLEHRLAPLPDTYCNGDGIRQVLLNLLHNAMDAVENSAQKIVRVDAEVANQAEGSNDAIVIRVGDTGEGIPEENLEQLGQLFFSTKPHGTGMGLAISYDIVKQNGGHIEIDSKVGEGTTFTLYLLLKKM